MENIEIRTGSSPRTRPNEVLADSAYDTKKIRDCVSGFSIRHKKDKRLSEEQKHQKQHSQEQKEHEG
ncbi:MAG: Transposase [Candidatus Methanohalarchaeum thermophilum]|uniref:Transposase n=1 Tax=Methanohalarchaeum thermophilum TaxID=1903181 RepID=A0A1Q6DSP0_METT1|nr:MAG: Transposase [Candidatus Methanohalarchaeum thermophilum]